MVLCSKIISQKKKKEKKKFISSVYFCSLHFDAESGEDAWSPL